MDVDYGGDLWPNPVKGKFWERVAKMEKVALPFTHRYGLYISQT